MSEKATAVLSKIKRAANNVMYVALWALVAVALMLVAVMVTFWLMPG